VSVKSLRFQNCKTWSQSVKFLVIISGLSLYCVWIYAVYRRWRKCVWCCQVTVMYYWCVRYWSSDSNIHTEYLATLQPWISVSDCATSRHSSAFCFAHVVVTSSKKSEEIELSGRIQIGTGLCGSEGKGTSRKSSCDDDSNRNIVEEVWQCGCNWTRQLTCKLRLPFRHYTPLLPLH
jgi:hypothetical protein